MIQITVTTANVTFYCDDRSLGRYNLQRKLVPLSLCVLSQKSKAFCEDGEAEVHITASSATLCHSRHTIQGHCRRAIGRSIWLLAKSECWVHDDALGDSNFLG